MHSHEHSRQCPTVLQGLAWNSMMLCLVFSNALESGGASLRVESRMMSKSCSPLEEPRSVLRVMPGR
jgi:hypothetical protein